MFVVFWGQGQRGKGDQSRFWSTTELGMCLRELKVQKKNCGSTVRLLIGLSGAALRFVRGCLLGLGAGIKQSLRGVRRGRYVGSTGEWNGHRKGCLRCSAVELSMSLGVWI